MKSELRSANSRSVMRSQVIGAVLLSLVCAGSAWAKDSMDVTVSNATGSPVVVNNGQAVGTIQLFYTVNATEFPLGGAFATFDVDWVVSQGQGKPYTDYGSGLPFSVTQDQQGGHVDLVPNPDTFTLTAAGQSGTSTVTV